MGESPHWRVWQSLAAKEAVKRGKIGGSTPPLHPKIKEAIKKNPPHKDGPHSSN